MKVAIKIILLLLVVGYLIFAVAEFTQRTEERICEAVDIQIADSLEGGFGRILTLYWQTEAGQPLILQSIYPARALELLGKKDYRFSGTGGPTLFGRQPPVHIRYPATPHSARHAE